MPPDVFSGNFSLILLKRRINKNIDKIVAFCNLYHSLEKDTKKKDIILRVIDSLTKEKGERKREKEELTSSRLQNLFSILSAAPR